MLKYFVLYLKNSFTFKNTDKNSFLEGIKFRLKTKINFTLQFKYKNI